MGIGFREVIVGILVLWALSRLAGGASALAFGPVLVLKRFHVDRNPADGLYVEIVGRPAGLLGWILATVGLEAETSLQITGNNVVKQSGSLEGKTRLIAPMPVIASGSVGYTKSIWALYVGVLAVLGGLVSGLSEKSAFALVVGILVGGILLAVYWFSNRLQISVETFGGSTIGLRFKRSVIENVDVDFEKAAAVVELLHQIMLASQSVSARSEKSSGSTVGRADARPVTVSQAAPARTVLPAPPPTHAPSSNTCPKCSATVDSTSIFCESCGTRLRA